MADIRLVWDQANGRADWTVVNGRLAAGSDLESILLLLLFTDRVAQPDYPAPDRRGWWGSSFQSRPYGSRLWQLERRKIVNRAALAAEAQVMGEEALAPMVTWNLVTAVSCPCEVPPPGGGQSGNLLVLRPNVTLLSGRVTPYRYAYTLT
jgi:phage gp46-like protein